MSTESEETSGIGHRKARHLSICTDPLQYSVEGSGAGLEGVRFIHDPLPEINEEEVDTRVPFLGHTASLPLFISCMTGGSARGLAANRALAEAAQRTGIPVGVGSIRVLFEKPELVPHFDLKPLAPDVPVLANLGAAQIRSFDQGLIEDMLVRLGVQSLVVHLNPGQELFQPEGDRDFRGLKKALAAYCRRSRLPVIVKETGFGMSPALVTELIEMGSAYVDLAGAGGTNWITVESYRLDEGDRDVAGEFRPRHGR